MAQIDKNLRPSPRSNNVMQRARMNARAENAEKNYRSERVQELGGCSIVAQRRKEATNAKDEMYR